MHFMKIARLSDRVKGIDKFVYYLTLHLHWLTSEVLNSNPYGENNLPSQHTVYAHYRPDSKTPSEVDLVSKKVTPRVCASYASNTIGLSNSYIMGCPPVRGDKPRALASGLSYMYVQVDKHGITILYHLYQCRFCTSRDIS